MELANFPIVLYRFYFHMYCIYQCMKLFHSYPAVSTLTRFHRSLQQLWARRNSSIFFYLHATALFQSFHICLTEFSTYKRNYSHEFNHRTKFLLNLMCLLVLSDVFVLSSLVKYWTIKNIWEENKSRKTCKHHRETFQVRILKVFDSLNTNQSKLPENVLRRLLKRLQPNLTQTSFTEIQGSFLKYKG